MQIPMSIAYRDYINKICILTDKSGLPAFVTVGVLEGLLAREKQRAEIELKHDEAVWRKAIADQNKDVTENGDK